VSKVKIKFDTEIIWKRRINIVPEPKQSSSFTKKGFAFTPAKKKRYQEAIRHAVSVCEDLPEMPHEGPLAIQVIFCFPLTKSDQNTKKRRAFLEQNGNWLFACSSRNDLDNLLKPVSDALNKLIIVDDGHICSANLVKIKAHQPFISIVVSKISYKVGGE